MTGIMEQHDICLDPDIQKEGARVVKKTNRELAKKIIDRACELQSFDILCGVANGILDIKAGLANIDPKLCEEMEYLCQKIPACRCDDCSGDLK